MRGLHYTIACVAADGEPSTEAGKNRSQMLAASIVAAVDIGSHIDWYPARGMPVYTGNQRHLI
jgi:hypothetical protein